MVWWEGELRGEKSAEERIAENSSMAHRRAGCLSLRVKIPFAQGPSFPPWISSDGLAGGYDGPKGSRTVRTFQLLEILSGLFPRISYPQSSKQDQLHDMWGLV